MRTIHHRGSPARLLGAALVVATGLTGCSSSLVSNQSVSACYRALPVGRTAIHDTKATLIGIHRVPADRVSPHLPPAARAELGAEDDTSVCAMTFKGTFAEGQVDLAPPDETGDYALVLVTTKRLQLLASAVLNQPPKGFGGRTV
jgi:hypothetical protein